MSILQSLKELFGLNQNKRLSLKNLDEEEDTLVVDDCIIPNQDIKMVDVKSNLENILKIMVHKEKNIDFILLYDNNIDNLVGIVYAKDLINTLVNNEKKDGCDFLFSPIVFVPYVMSVDKAIETMYEKDTEVLVVVDSRGNTLGVVTKSSIVNFIYMYKVTEKYFEKNTKNNQIIVDGRLLLKHIPSDWNIKEFKNCHNRTIGGFLSSDIGSIAPINTEVEISSLKFKVIEGNEKVIKKILITKAI